jgi:PhzF family phenazine biosynthesis protein
MSVYRTFFNSSQTSSGGKEIAVLEGIFAPVRMQEIAASSGVPLTVFIKQYSGSSLNLKVFTPKGEKGESDSGALAALFHLFGNEQPSLHLFGNQDSSDVADVAVIMSETLQARCEDGLWWLEQGTVTVQTVELDPLRVSAALNTPPDQIQPHMYTSSTGRPKLLVTVPDTQILDAIRPDYAALQELNIQTGSSGVIVLTTHAPRAESNVDIRFFMPKQSKEDNAGANTAACVLGYLVKHLGIPRAEIAQGYAMEKPSSLFARHIEGRVWVGGMVSRVK